MLRPVEDDKDILEDEPRREYLVSVRYYSAALDLYSNKGLMEEDDRFELLLQLGC